MSTRLSAGGGNEMASFNIAAGEAPAAQSTNLSGANGPNNESHSLLSQAEYFADEMVLGGLEKREIMGMRVNRRMSLAMVVCFGLALLTLVTIIGKALFGGSGDEEEFKAVEISKEESTRRFNAFQNMLEPLTGTSITESGTPEYNTLEWLASSDPAMLPTDAHIDLVTQRFVLATLWEATNGRDWGHQYSFRSHYDVCDWNHGSRTEFGAYCNGDGVCREVDFGIAICSMDCFLEILVCLHT